MPTYTHAQKLKLDRATLVIERDRHLSTSAAYAKWQEYIDHYDVCQTWAATQVQKALNDRGNLDTAPVPPSP